MDTTVLRKLAALGFVAILFVALLYLFALNQVADTTTPAMAAALDETLVKSLEPGAKCRVTMARDGTGVSAPRVYTAKIRLSAAVAADAAAAARVCNRGAAIVASFLDEVRAPVTVRCVAEDAAGRTVFEAAFTRPGGSRDEIVPGRPTPAPVRPPSTERKPDPATPPAKDAPR